MLQIRTITAENQGMITSQHPLPVLISRSRQVLFEAGRDGYALCRIPVLTATTRGTLLAICEARRGDSGDWNETHLLLRRSEDGGVTWDAPRPVHGDHGAEPLNPLRGDHGFTGSHVHGNAVLIPGPDAVVHLVYCLEYHRVFHRLSRDDGRTWEPARDISAALNPLRPRYPFRVCATGPGHGARLRDGTLVVPVWLSLGSGGHGHRPSVVTVLRGEADGTTWSCGDLIAVDGDHAVDGRVVRNPNESALVELADGRLLIGMRTESAANRRLHAVSTDGGRSFAQSAFVDALYDVVCEASYARQGSRILFTAPDPRDGGAAQIPGSNQRVQPRRRLILAASHDEGATWRHVGVVEAGLAGYSHLATHGGRTWCLFETGSTDGDMYKSGCLALVELEGVSA